MLRGVTDEELAAIAQRDHTTVMKNTYDNNFDPWDNRRVRAAVSGVVAAAKRLKNVEEVKAFIETDKELAEFTRLHPTISEKLSDISIVENPKHMQVIDFLLDTQYNVQQNSLEAGEAASRVAAFAMKNLERQAATRK